MNHTHHPIETESNPEVAGVVDDEEWSHGAYVDDGEHALEVCTRWADDAGTTVEWKAYVAEAGHVEEHTDEVATEEFGRDEINNLADAAKQLLDDLDRDGRTPLDLARHHFDV